MKLACLCACHQEARGNYESAVQGQRWHEAMAASNTPIINQRVPVEAHDPIEAAVAQGCDCLANHCPALLSHTTTQRHLSGQKPAEVIWNPDEGEGKE